MFIWKRHFTIFYKYICCWLMAEAACDITGVAYMGRNKDGSPHWYFATLCHKGNPSVVLLQHVPLHIPWCAIVCANWPTLALPW